MTAEAGLGVIGVAINFTVVIVRLALVVLMTNKTVECACVAALVADIAILVVRSSKRKSVVEVCPRPAEDSMAIFTRGWKIL